MSETPTETPVPLLLNESRLIEQISRGPTLHAATAQQLRNALKQRFPDLDIDPDMAVVMSPLWREHNGALVSDSCRFESLSHALVRLALDQASANYIEGEHFLTLTPYAEEPVHLPVGMDALTVLLNEQAPQIFAHFQQAQLDHWNEPVGALPRWQALSDMLKAALDVESVNGWDADLCALCRQVSRFPDKASRPPEGSGLTNVRARMVDLDYAFDFAEAIDTRHLMSPGALVLTANRGGRDLIVMYTVFDGYEAFDSLEQLGAVLPERIDVDLGGSSLKWRLYEPEGNVFDAMAWALVNCQLDSIDALDPASPSAAARLTPRRTEIRTLSARDNQRMAQLVDAMPPWLSAGSLDDIQAYSGYLNTLGLLREGAEDAFAPMNLASIQTYAQQRMREAIIAQRPGAAAAALHLDDVRVTVTQSFETGGFTLPSPLGRSIQTLGQFALSNTPPYMATVAYADDSATPDWLTPAFLVRIAESIDVGETYPQLIKRTLIDDPVQARRHRLRYCRQLPTLLQLRALECKLKQEGNVDDRGYRQICRLAASMAGNAPSADWPVQIRPLAFMPQLRPGSGTDTVTGMYIIGPGQHRSGPCLLYRPLMERSLLQFESGQNLLYALHQPGELRDSVLAWLADDGRSFEYAQYVFPNGMPSPRTIADLAFEPFIHLGLSPSIRLAGAPLTGDIPATLFRDHSQALAMLADRQSTSNAERRRALLVDSGWAVFGVAANFLSGPAGTAVWVWQIIVQIQQAIEARERGDTEVQWSSTGDVLLTLSILLTHRMAWRRLRLSGPSDKNALLDPTLEEAPLTDAPVASMPAKVVQEPALSSPRLPEAHLGGLAPINGIRTSSGTRFEQLMDRLQVTAPGLPAQARPNADHLHESAGRTYAQVGRRWFEVRYDRDGPVSVIDPDHPERSGLCIRFDHGEGRWVWDLRLRLRGGQPSGRIRAFRQEKAKRMAEAWTALQAFLTQEPALKAALEDIVIRTESQDPQTAVPESTLTDYLARSDTLSDGYTKALADLENWRKEGGTGVFYQAQLIRLTVEQHRCINGWVRLKLREYIRHVKPMMSQAPASEPSARAQQREATLATLAVSNAIVERLDRMDSTLAKLMSGTGQTREAAGKLEKLRPPLSRFDFLANEVGMSVDLCLQERAGSASEATRQMIFSVFDEAGDAGHALVERRAASEPGPASAQETERVIALVDRLEGCQKRMEDLLASSPEQLEPTRYRRIAQLIAEFRQLARSRLLELLPAPEEIPIAAMVRLETGPSTSRPVGKVNKLRPRVLETERPGPAAKPEPLENVPIVKVPPRRTVQPPSADDDQILGKGLALYNDNDLFIKHTTADSRRPRRIPADMKDLFEQQAARLEQAAKDVHAAYGRKKASGNTQWIDSRLSSDLKSAAQKCRREGVRVYSDMIMSRKPRETYLQWLHEHDRIDIVKDPRGRIKTRQRKDWFQEYRVLDKTRQNKPLWVAHFHYGNVTDADGGFTVAHLKLADEYLKSLPDTARQELSTFDDVDNALRRLTTPQVLDLFLKGRSAGPSSP
ncbi:hypothetical protein KVG96_24880 [Pseudomonas sp. COR58]|uniref:Dermonecrotic toxin N-terminal domain-containing protein n=1 Tax=Pseudomonas ekonensis TaxID=2842353 RepID=A0ABS6PL66_9PSED|nr:DUF6543 domain-containing protein [Pseudomonas ekonensis]MBV4461205.1 hypothetical protein [Pseudomonas ekonensis]